MSTTMETPNKPRPRSAEVESFIEDYNSMSIGVADDAIQAAMWRPDWREIFEAFNERSPEGFDPNWECYYKGSITSIALRMGKYDVAEYLLSLGADPNIATAYETSLLEEVAKIRGDGAPALSKLLGYGAKTENDRALHFAAAAGCLAKTKLLLDANIDLRALRSGPHKDLTKGTPLHEAAAAHFNPSEKKHLIDNRWDPDEQVKVIEALLAAGADPEADDEDGKKPRAWAAARPGYEKPKFKLRDQEHIDEVADEPKHIKRVQTLLERHKESTLNV